MENEKSENQHLSDTAKKIVDLMLTLNQVEDPLDMMRALVEAILEFSRAEGITIYKTELKYNELRSLVKIQGLTPDDSTDIRIPISDESIAGYAAKHRKIVNLQNVYDPKKTEIYPGIQFDETWDNLTGYKTKQTIAVPLLYKKTGLQGVIQLVNTKKPKGFSAADIKLLTLVSHSLAVALYNKSRIKSSRRTKFDFLLKKNVISQKEIDEAIENARKNVNHPLKGDVVSIIINDYRIPKKMIGEALEMYYNAEFIEYNDNIFIPSELLNGLNEKYLRRSFWVPLSIADGVLTVIMDDPDNPSTISEIKECMKAKKYKYCVGLREDILAFIDLATDKKQSTSSISSIFEELEQNTDKIELKEDTDEEDLLNEDAPTIVRMVNKIIQDSYEKGASDIHIEPYDVKKGTIVRIRQDGICYKYAEVANTHTRAIVNRIKIMSTGCYRTRS